MRKIYKALIIGSGAAAYGCADWLYREGVTDIAVVLGEVHLTVIY